MDRKRLFYNNKLWNKMFELSLKTTEGKKYDNYNSKFYE